MENTFLEPVTIGSLLSGVNCDPTVYYGTPPFATYEMIINRKPHETNSVNVTFANKNKQLVDELQELVKCESKKSTKLSQMLLNLEENSITLKL